MLGIRVSGGALTGIDFLPSGAAAVPAADAAARSVCERLAAWFRDASAPLDLPLRLLGTPFQLRVWQALREIPPGTVVTYGELARRLGSSARAVGGACRRNPVPIVVPCHRVVAASGWGGFDGQTAGDNLRIKQWLLNHEAAGAGFRLA